MALGLGHNYWVHCLKHHVGDLDSCIKFMQENKPSTKEQWFELTPIVSVKKKHATFEHYRCLLVEDGSK